MRVFSILALLGVAGIACCQSELQGPSRFPETREMSGMPGGSFGVLPDGTPSIKGSMALSTPIAYGLDHWHWAGGVNSTSTDSKFTGLDFRSHGTVSSGTAELMVGIPTKWGAFTYSAMPIDIHFRMATNLQFTPVQHGMVKVGIGVQDLFNDTRTFHPKEFRNSRSPYIVATANPIEGGYVSLGYGNQRFGGVFGSVSKNIGNWNAMAEYDTYNWNYGLANRIGHFRGGRRDVDATLFAGMIRGKYATASLVFSF
jgi:hypothetical protein